MRKIFAGASLAFFLIGCFCTLQAQTPHREVAFTIDDLPLVGGSEDLQKVQSVNQKLLAALTKHQIHALGFVNEARFYQKGEIDARVEILRGWLDAGMVLGNHTYSHPDLNTTPLAQFEDDTIRGDVIIKQLMRERGLNLRYFRFPFNHAGPTKEIRDSFQSFAKARGYLITPFTIEHEDYIFASAYNKALNGNDGPLAQRIRTAYLDHLDAMFDFMERQCKLILGYEPRQIFLIHVNQLNADSLDDMAQRLKRRGYCFITIDEAMEDKAYQLRDDYVGNHGISWLYRWAIGLGRKPDYKDEPQAPQFVLDVYNGK